MPESDDKALAIDENRLASVVKVRVLRFVETRVGSVDYKVTGTSQVCDASDTRNAGFFEGVSIGPFDSADKCAGECRFYDGFRYNAAEQTSENCVCQYGNVRGCALTSSTWSQYEILKEAWKVVGSDLKGAEGDFTGHDVSLSRDGSWSRSAAHRPGVSGEGVRDARDILQPG